jgi:hypothetical protein
MSDFQNLRVKARRTRHNIVKMGAIDASAAVATLATANPGAAQNNQGQNNNKGRTATDAC